MAARIVNLGASFSRPRVAAELAPLGAPGYAAGGERLREQHEWRGASGHGYRHVVYALIECPPLPPASYVLVHRDERGRRVPLRIGVGSSDAPTLNLAQVRQSGARVGANEVHVRVGTASEAERRLVACDLRAGLLGTLAAEPGAEV